MMIASRDFDTLDRIFIKFSKRNVFKIRYPKPNDIQINVFKSYPKISEI